jgi:outer membrane beta-barrel protein
MTMPTNTRQRRFALIAASFAAAVVTAAPLAAHAQRKSPLEDAPAIRKRVELRETRFEIGVGASETITQDFFHTTLLGPRVAFHLTDWLTIAGFYQYGIYNAETGFQSRVVQTLPTAPDPSAMRTPTMGAAQASMQKIKGIAGAQLEFVPFTGKYSLFGKLFAHYDFYIFGGAGFLDVEPSAPGSCDTTMVSYCGVTGWKLGGHGGLGLHTFFTDYLALNVELRDFVTKLNPSGRDNNGDGVANDKDSSITQTVLATVNLTFFLPPHAPISQ